MSNQNSFAEPKNNVDNCFIPLPDLKDSILKNNSQVEEDKHLSDALTNPFSENDGWNEKKDKEAREAYIMAQDCGSYDYYKFIRYFPEDEAELVKCPTCEEMIYSDEQNGMCYICFKNEQKLYPDDIPMELRYRN
jgi:formylmethanofuran dehydrogenase subunit E